MQALEAKVLVLKMLVDLVGVCMLQFHLLVLGNNGPLASHEVIHLLSVFDSANHALSLHNLLELFKADFVNLIRVHRFLQEPLHFLSLLL